MKETQNIHARLLSFFSGARKRAFFSAIVIGLIAHIYKFTNTLYNHDALYCLYSTNDMPGSGRWLLSLACLPSSYFDLPWINGLLSLLYIGLTAAVIADIFKVRYRGTAILIGGLLAAFPCVTATFFYEFTADGYMLAMLLAALSVRLNPVGDKSKLHIAAAALLVCLCCGIYQAYVSFALLLSMSHFIVELLNEKREDKQLYRWIGKQFIVYGVGLASYYIIWKLRLLALGMSATDYQGINELGLLNAGGFVLALQSIAKTLVPFFLGGNVFKYGLSFYAFVNILFLLALAALLVFSAVKLRKKLPRLLLLLLSVVSLPFFACIWFFVSSGVFYHPVMLQSLCLLYILSLVLAERLCAPKPREGIALLLAVAVFTFVLQANMAYFQLERSNRTTHTTASEMLTRIHLLDDGSVEKIAFVGGGELSIVASNEAGTKDMKVLANMIKPDLIYDHTHGALYFTSVLKSGYTPLNPDEVEALEASGLTDDMPVWPLEGSVRIIGDTAVIKLPEYPED